MDFRGPPKPTPYFSRRDQVRLFLMTLSLVIVAFAINRVRQADFFAWMFPPEQGEVVPAGEAKGEFVGDDLPSTAVADAYTEPPPDEWLSLFRDDTVNVLAAEKPAYFGLLSRAKAADPAAFEKAAEEQPSRTVLMHNPDHFRGRLVEIEGELRRLVPFDVSEPRRSEYGLGQLWDAWISMPDAPADPLHVVVSRVPDTLPQGMQIDVPAKVRVTGWFLKRQAFSTGDDLTRTPLIVGSHLRHVQPPVVVGDPGELTPYIIGFAVVIAVSLAAVLLWYSHADKKFGDAHIKHFTEAPEGAIEALDGVETTDPADVMRRLAEADTDEDDTVPVPAAGGPGSPVPGDDGTDSDEPPPQA